MVARAPRRHAGVAVVVSFGAARERKGHIAEVQAPQPLLPAAAESRLTSRQREILGALESLALQDGFADLTMAQLAARLNCSLRTLYGVAPRKDDLLMIVIDRRLHRIGRSAMAAIEPGMNPLVALRAYLSAVTVAVAPTTETFARELSAIPGATRLVGQHGNYVISITKELLDQAQQQGLIKEVDTTAMALVLGGLGSFFSRQAVIPVIEGTPKEAADGIMEVIVDGLVRSDS